MANYDPQNFESVLLYMRQEFGTGVFREAGRMYSIICDLSPKMKPYGNVMRQLCERGALSELDAARNDDLRSNRALMKARDILENELLLSAERAEYFLGVIRTVYGIAAPPSAPQSAPIPPPTQMQPPPEVKTPPTLTQVRTLPPARIIELGNCGKYVTFTLDERGVLTIFGNGSMWDFTWDVDKQATNAQWWYQRKIIFHVEIQDGVTTVARQSFRDCTNLKSVTIPNSVTKIGCVSFAFCKDLTKITIPNNVTKIESYAFRDCTKLINVTIPDSVTVIEEGTVWGCTGLTNVKIPKSVTTIGDEAFSHCKGLTSVTIPDSVTTIGKKAFYGCVGLQSVSIPAHTKFTTGLFKRTFPLGTRIERRA